MISEFSPKDGVIHSLLAVQILNKCDWYCSKGMKIKAKSPGTAQDYILKSV